jgi:hypothetical protein
LQVVEWIIEMPHPVLLSSDKERAALATESANLLTITVPSSAAGISEKAEAATTLLSGGVTVASSVGGSPVYLNNSMDLSTALQALASLAGCQHIAVARSGQVRTGWTYTVTFAADQYAAGEVPVLSITSNDLGGARAAALL